MCKIEAVLDSPKYVRVMYEEDKVLVVDNDSGELACANTSRVGVADWLVQQGYSWLAGSDGVWHRA